ncbi:DUF1428 family protein [Halobacillus sp. ACCC02827]|uniref:DUF1428 family protein n=1 Tax=Bacillaceae TaxID=186817 RepID=UPI0002A4E7C9|nr:MULTISPECIES: DUF1428 family protein [Bacillaceae]ELK48921.1 hypothetical protein D479_01470 [Halobacillus sp. BAB-2008]QHT45752.1 DUF1428 family protein [Bacillus sp. SB49]WJE16552.1 DUF1428 family protein [Halobacillus sp. ACCC02827]
MYTVLCIFRVKKEKLDDFLKTAKKSGEMLQSHGSLEHTIYFSKELTGRQGSMGILNLIELEEDEELLLGQSIFESEESYHEVMKSIGFNDIIHYLNGHIKDIVEMNRVVTSSFTTEPTTQMK